MRIGHKCLCWSLPVDCMMLFENLVADCMQQTDNHVRDRGTPAFGGNTLLVRGVCIENYEIEDSMLFNRETHFGSLGELIDSVCVSCKRCLPWFSKMCGVKHQMMTERSLKEPACIPNCNSSMQQGGG